MRGFALAAETELARAVAAVAAAAPFRNMKTPGGFTMSVAMTNCGRLGWVSSEHGYRYAEQDPETGAPWPAMPAAMLGPRAPRGRCRGFRSLRRPTPASSTATSPARG